MKITLLAINSVLDAITLDAAASVTHSQLQAEGLDTTPVIFDDLGLVVDSCVAASEKDILLPQRQEAGGHLPPAQ